MLPKTKFDIYPSRVLQEVNPKGAGSTALVRNLNRQWIQPYLSQGLTNWMNVLSGAIESLHGLNRRTTRPMKLLCLWIFARHT